MRYFGTAGGPDEIYDRRPSSEPRARLPPTGTTRYLLDGLSVIAQYAPDGQRQAWYTQSLARIDEVLSVANDTGKFWYQADALGSVYGLTNQAGALIGSQSYDVFGAPTPAPSGPAGQPFGFTGREHELDSGLVYARARYLNPAVGRWDRPDPLGFVDGPNRYLYAHARPTRFTDPTGNLAGLPLIPLLLTDLAFAINLDVGLLISFGFPGVVFVVGGVVATIAAVAVLVSLVMLIDAYRVDHAISVAVGTAPPSKCPAPSANWHVQTVPTTMLRFTDPRTMSDEAFDEFASEVERDGILVPIKAVWHDGQYWIVDGNHRLRAALRSGLTEVPVEEVTLPYGAFRTTADLEEYSLGNGY